MIEGCVRETFGAMVAHWQALHAPDAATRRTFARIARDETRHAALAWSIAKWASQKLDPKSRARLARIRRDAVAALADELSASHLRLEPPADVARTLGLPTAQQATALLTHVMTGLEQ
jgi:hypothetical protein